MRRILIFTMAMTATAGKDGCNASETFRKFITAHQGKR